MELQQNSYKRGSAIWGKVQKGNFCLKGFFSFLGGRLLEAWLALTVGKEASKPIGFHGI